MDIEQQKILISALSGLFITIGTVLTFYIKYAIPQKRVAYTLRTVSYIAGWLCGMYLLYCFLL